MIRFDEQKRSFNLSGPSYSYVMMVDGEGRLLNLHWGARVPDGDLNYLIDGYWSMASFDRLPQTMPHELPTQEGAYFGIPALSVRNAQGDTETSLRYVSHSIIPGKPGLPGLPASYVDESSEAETLVITMKDQLTGVVAELSYTVFSDKDVLAKSMKIINTGCDTVELDSMLSASVPLFGQDYDFLHLKGAWARERAVERHPVNRAENRISSRRGASGHEENPFIAVMDHTATEDAGRVWSMQLVYSGSFTAAADTNNFATTRMMIGLNPEVCRWMLGAGESFQAPEALLTYSGEGLGGLSTRLHAFLRRHVVRGRWRDRVRPILVNNWEGTYFDFNEEKLLAIASKAKEMGLELFVLDDGWFGKRNSDDSSLGDWFVNLEKLPCGIDGLAEKITDMGLMFGIWYEPEMISPVSELYKAHPDWCLHVDGRPRSEARNQLILDFSRKEVQDYIIDIMSGMLKKAKISYIKWDMNRNMSEAFSCVLPKERKLETQHRYILGLYRVLETLTDEFPEVLFECCSGGGGRFDAGMLYYMPQTWTSDDTDACERLFIQYGTSIAYPPSAMGAHVSAVPNHQVNRVTSIKMRGDVALSGNFGYELDLSKLSDEDVETAKRHIALVKSIRGTLQQGDFYRIESPYEGNFCAWQFVSKDGNEIVFCGYQILQRANALPHRWFMRGLDPEAMYQDAVGHVYSGAALMSAGIPARLPGHDFASEIIQLRKK